MAGIEPNTIYIPGGSRFIPSGEIDAQRREAEERQNEAPITNLAAHLRRLWWAAKQAKEPVERELLSNLRQKQSEYDPQKLAEIREAGGSEVYMSLTSVKCRTAAAMIRDIDMPDADDRSWAIEPTPIPDIPPEMKDRAVQQIEQEAMMFAQQTGLAPLPDDVMARAFELKDEIKKLVDEQAKMAAERMQDKIDDELVEGNWNTAFSQFIEDVVTFKSAILKGPVIRRRNRLTWDRKEFYGRSTFKPQVKRELVKEYERRSPFDIYPSPGARHIQEGYLFDRHKLSLLDLEAMKGVDGYDDDAIDAVILEYGRGGLREWLTNDQERARVEGRPYEYLTAAETIDALNFWGEVPGFMLSEMGVEGIDQPSKVYSVEAWLIGRWVIKAVINPDPVGRRPYSMTSFEKIPGAFWGNGIPDLIRDCQQMVNAAARALSNNMGIASGPQVVINDVSRLPPGEKVTQVYPWKVWTFGKDGVATSYRPPIEFFQPNPLVEALLKVFEFYSTMADQYTNLPAYSHGGGEQMKGALSTASGMSMALGQTAKGLKMVIRNIDLDVIEERLKDHYRYNMIHDPDPAIKGDSRIKARGSAALIQREQQQLRRKELLDATNNPVDLSIMGLDGRAYLLKEVFKAADFNADKVIPEGGPAMLPGQVPNAPSPPRSQAADAAGQPVVGQDHRLTAES